MLKLGRYFGIPLNIHWTAFIAVLAIGAISLLGTGETWSVALTNSLRDMAVLTAAFGIVVLHEYGHAFAAIRRGVGVRSITVWLIGGVAALREPEDLYNPSDEFWISVAGPAVNAALFLASVPLLMLIPEETLAASAVKVFAGINLILLGFNLIPAFPMDGGRILRSLLSMRLRRHVANKWTSYLAMSFGVVFVGLGIWQGLLLLPVVGVIILYINTRMEEFE